MRIAIITRRLSGRGGMETAIQTLARFSPEYGADVQVWMMGQPVDRDWLQNIPSRYWNIDQGTGRRLQLKAKLPLYIAALWNALRYTRVDVLLATDPIFIQAALVARRALTHPPAVISWLHFSLQALANTRYIALADGHLAISHGIAQQIITLGPKHSPTVVYNPLPETGYPLINPPARPEFLYMGRLSNHQKRVDLLLTSLSDLDLPWHATLVGDGPDRNSLERMAETYHISDRLCWMGWQNAPWKVAPQPTCLVLSSDFEGFPMVLLESLARGIPVIATDCPTGPADIIYPGRNGLLVPVNKPKPLTDALASIALNGVEWTPSTIQADTLKRFGPQAVVSSIMQVLNQTTRRLSSNGS